MIDSGFRPDLAAVPLDDALNDSQTYSRPLVVLGPMQTLEDAEEFVSVAHVEANAVVLDEIDVSAVVALAADFDDGRFALAGVLEGVGKQIDPDLLEQSAGSAWQDGRSPKRISTLRPS